MASMNVPLSLLREPSPRIAKPAEPVPAHEAAAALALVELFPHLRSASDAALAELFPALRVRAAAPRA